MRGKSKRKRVNTSSSPSMLVDPSTTFLTQQRSMKVTEKRKRLKDILNKAARPILEEGLTSPCYHCPNQYVPNGQIRPQFLPDSGFGGGSCGLPVFPSVIKNQVITPINKYTGEPSYSSGNFGNTAVQGPLGTHGRDTETRQMCYSYANSNPPGAGQASENSFVIPEHRNNVAASLSQLLQGFVQQERNILVAVGHLQQTAQPGLQPLQAIPQHEADVSGSHSQEYTTIEVSAEELTHPGSLCIYCRLPVWRSNFEIRHCGHYFHCSCFLHFDHSYYLNCCSCLAATPVFVVNIDRLVGFRRQDGEQTE